MFATTIALLSTSYEGRDRGIAFGVWGAINGAAAAAGPILGGLLTEGLSWRWIFFVNLPISVVAVALAVYALSKDEPRRAGRVDLPGMVAFTVSAAAVTYALTRASDAGWGSAQTIGLLGAERRGAARVRRDRDAVTAAAAGSGAAAPAAVQRRAGRRVHPVAGGLLVSDLHLAVAAVGPRDEPDRGRRRVPAAEPRVADRVAGRRAVPAHADRPAVGADRRADADRCQAPCWPPTSTPAPAGAAC